jgi:hypothetical protein
VEVAGTSASGRISQTALHAVLFFARRAVAISPFERSRWRYVPSPRLDSDVWVYWRWLLGHVKLEHTVIYLQLRGVTCTPSPTRWTRCRCPRRTRRAGRGDCRSGDPTTLRGGRRHSRTRRSLHRESGAADDPSRWIHFYGFLAPRRRTEDLPRCRLVLTYPAS